MCRFHIDALNLPVVNGPNEGVMLMVINYFANAYFGTALFVDARTLGNGVAEK